LCVDILHSGCLIEKKSCFDTNIEYIYALFPSQHDIDEMYNATIAGKHKSVNHVLFLQCLFMPVNLSHISPDYKDSERWYTQFNLYKQTKMYIITQKKQER